MPLKLIRGAFKIKKASPDGDSVRFYPFDNQAWKKYLNRVRANQAGGAQLRLDAIDAVELHYNPRDGSMGVQHQPLPFARSAAATVLNYLGYTNVIRNPDEIVTSCDPEEVPGYILSRYADTYGRPVAFAFVGDHTGEDGKNVHLDQQLLRRSLNYHMLSQGQAYPTYYSKLYPDIREELTSVVKKQRGNHKGIWKVDLTTAGFDVIDIATLTEIVVFFPKLFRRLIDYLSINDGSISLSRFSEYLESRNDRIIVYPDGHVTGFDYVVSVQGQNLKLLVAPEQIIFLEK